VTTATLCDIRDCLEGAIPAVLATCDADGVPNVAYLSQVFFVDDRHVALSFQFFNKTRRNILANPRAVAMLIHPVTVAFYRLHLRYLRTETQGPLFERMKAQLAGIASHSGMDGVFELLGSDIYEVEQVEAVAGAPLLAPPATGGRLAALRLGAERIGRSTTLDGAFDAFLATLGDGLGMRHAIVLVLDARPKRLYTVASRGYPTSGVGSEIMVGQGVIGVAARERVAVRISHVVNAALYSQALRSSVAASSSLAPADEIPYPGLARPHSQLAVPILSMDRLLGVVFVESPRDRQFGHEDEDALVALTGHLGAAMELLQVAGEVDSAPAAAPVKAPAPAGEMALRRFKANDSIFVDDAYLIKGVAGAILWKLARDHVQQGRTEFSNRELRLDTSLGLPDVTDNLEARLLLLQRRLQEHGPHLRIERTGRGRFRLAVGRKLQLSEV
jgi:adenylate cyclase